MRALRSIRRGTGQRLCLGVLAMMASWLWITLPAGAADEPVTRAPSEAVTATDTKKDTKTVNERPATFAAFLDALWPQAQRAGITRATFAAAFKGVTPDRKLPDLQLAGRRKPTGGQAEFVKPPSRYLSARNLESLAAMGRTRAARYENLLAGISDRFGVPGEIVMAIWGRETVYSQYRIRHDLIRALATQAFLGRRREMFRAELLLALRILQEGHAARSEMKSSWAGAMGKTQFMPSNFYEYGVDWNDDGKRDIWGSVPDALASTAKSLADNEWVRGARWGYEIAKPVALDCALEGPTNMRPLGEWADAGLMPARQKEFSQAERALDTYLLLPEGTRGPVFLVTRNFLAIKSYNFSDLYALFVGNLADRIAGRGAFQTPWATNSQLKTELVKQLQATLNALGYDAGKVDGFIGTGTRSAIGRFQKSNSLEADCFPSQSTLQAAQRVAIQRLAATLPRPMRKTAPR